LPLLHNLSSLFHLLVFLLFLFPVIYRWTEVFSREVHLEHLDGLARASRAWIDFAVHNLVSCNLKTPW